MQLTTPVFYYSLVLTFVTCILPEIILKFISFYWFPVDWQIKLLEENHERKWAGGDGSNGKERVDDGDEEDANDLGNEAVDNSNNIPETEMKLAGDNLFRTAAGRKEQE